MIIKKLWSNCRHHTVPKIARISSNYAMESPQSVHNYDAIRSFLYKSVDQDFSIEYFKVKQYFLKSTSTKRQK